MILAQVQLSEIEFAWPWAFALLALIPLVSVRLLLTRHARLTYSAAPRASVAHRSWRVRLRFLPGLLRLLSMAFLILALARPQTLDAQTETKVNGIAMQIVVDRSGSMDEPANFDNQDLNRLEAVKRVVAEFVAGNGEDLEGRSGDLIGLIAFGTYADTVCPLVREIEPLLSALETVRIPILDSEQGTAIGDAVALAAARLQSAEDELAASEQAQDDFTIKGKAIVLLTDGDDRNSQIAPEVACELAAEWGIRVYIIGIQGRSRGGLFSGRNAINEASLANAAESTGGRFWSVENLADLREIYAEIDRLEKTEIEVDEQTTREERFAWALRPALILLALDLLASLTVFRRWP